MSATESATGLALISTRGRPSGNFSHSPRLMVAYRRVTYFTALQGDLGDQRPGNRPATCVALMGQFSCAVDARRLPDHAQRERHGDLEIRWEWCSREWNIKRILVRW